MIYESEREKAMRMSVEIVERLIDDFDFSSIEFKINYKRLLQWLHLCHSFNENKEISSGLLT